LKNVWISWERQPVRSPDKASHESDFHSVKIHEIQNAAGKYFWFMKTDVFEKTFHWSISKQFCLSW